MYVATRYNGRPAVLDTRTKVYYLCRTMARAIARAAELNAADGRASLL